LASMAEVDDFPDNGFDDSAFNGAHGEDLNEALKQGFRRAGMHWMRAGYELLAGVGAFLEELSQKSTEADDPDEPIEHIELE
jgi:hypothetical protein